ncbi:MAG: aldehyde ferredoxin oxidoreductase [Anaerolineales bacterium]|nr:MAG: aldehyde ferredoxin oxidoreductase [Anaerolineales bacterium]
MSYRLGRYDLSNRTLENLHVPDDLWRTFMGGSGIAAALLYPVLTLDMDPLSPEAPLLLATGPLTGTRGPAVGRFTICGKSPATNLWGESNIGGHAGPELRAAGFDGLWITGKSEHPVYLWVTEGSVEIRPASHLWGSTDTYETQSIIRAELGQRSAKVLTIGVAGEKLLPYALILSDHGRVAGRTGMGAIMGSKNLKAIVIRGGKDIPIASGVEFSSLRGKVNRELRDDLVSKGLRDFGTASASDIFDYFGMMPKRYFSSGSLEGTEKISGPSLSETILTGVSTCHGCVIACGRKVKLGDGIERKGPEYETTIGFGPNLGITDLEAITRMGERCDQLGMDTISFSTTFGLAIYLYQEGIIGKRETSGQALVWGNAELVMEMIVATARREGFGALLALGARGLARTFGVPELAAEVKGLELAFHDPRGATGVALVYATSPRGACHNQSHYYLVEIGQTIESIGVELLGRQDVEKKPANVARHQDWVSVLNALVMCIFATVPASETVELLNLATGWDYSLEEAMLAGERIWNLKRIINHRLGATKAHDQLPDYLMQPLAQGGAAGCVPPLEKLLSRYYEVRGWDPSSGSPTDKTRTRLGLDHTFPA